jgi:peptidoglycan/xylan/chitin deacetylase (PgdA/CDA1 family)
LKRLCCAELGNHAHSHFDVNGTPLEQYTADITRGEEPLRSVLAAKGYTVAPVTLDNADCAYAASYLRPEDRERAQRESLPYMESLVAFFEARSVEVVGRRGFSWIHRWSQAKGLPNRGEPDPPDWVTKGF